jgi:hypothetical protein
MFLGKRGCIFSEQYAYALTILPLPCLIMRLRQAAKMVVLDV